MTNFAPYRNIAIVLAAIALAASTIFAHFPAIADYSIADEATYYQQASRVQLQGLAGFRDLGREYLQDRGLHEFPNPLRFLPITINALALSVADSFRTLSLLSLAFFILLCIMAYFYIAAVWSADVAVVAVALLCFSPLQNAMAKRALIDSLSCLVMAFSLFSFLVFITRKTGRQLAVFSCALLLVLLMRETGALVLPFYFFTLIYLKKRGRLQTGLGALALCFALPLGLTAIIYQMAYGLTTVLEIYRSLWSDQVLAASAYSANYLAGPWYRYLVDFIILSPTTLLLGVLYAGSYVLQNKHTARTSVLLLFFCYLFAVYAFLPKDIRFVIALDVIIRLLAAFAISEGAAVFISRQAVKNIAIVLAALAVISADSMTFRRHFVSGNIYDPVSYNLLQAERFIPAPAPQKSSPAPAVNRPLAQTLLNKSFSYYKKGRYADSMALAETALAAYPDFAEAYSNICAAAAELQQWDRAIAAGETAVKLAPDNALAQGNLAWAKRQKARPHNSNGK